MAFNSQQEKSIAAFVTALGQQEESLPTGLQAQLQAIGQNLEGRISEIPVIAASLPSLNQSYQAALADTTDSKPGATLVSSTNQEHSAKVVEQAAQIFTDADPVQAAQRSTSRSFGQVASNPLKRFFGRG